MPEPHGVKPVDAVWNGSASCGCAKAAEVEQASRRDIRDTRLVLALDADHDEACRGRVRQDLHDLVREHAREDSSRRRVALLAAIA
eukprot:CAMPEP_0179855000 /NCGR_PEP_ID=MMETSP0982-20121206/10274_1 /TAXON_ID=483367 /ORGANISM="non described non described, Strain CCMP 2436" /LENGTH=85 /DNA_ID=CAMNT_0021741005 /DNA_START=97 /DNA_END=352 /DNA_ORIENTATION=-